MAYFNKINIIIIIIIIIKKISSLSLWSLPQVMGNSQNYQILAVFLLSVV